MVVLKHPVPESARVTLPANESTGDQPASLHLAAEAEHEALTRPAPEPEPDLEPEMAAPSEAR
jgi:hypothetical protein